MNDDIYTKLSNIEYYLAKIYEILLRYEREDANREIEQIRKSLEDKTGDN